MSEPTTPRRHLAHRSVTDVPARNGVWSRQLTASIAMPTRRISQEPSTFAPEVRAVHDNPGVSCTQRSTEQSWQRATTRAMDRHSFPCPQKIPTIRYRYAACETALPTSERGPKKYQAESDKRTVGKFQEDNDPRRLRPILLSGELVPSWPKRVHCPLRPRVWHLAKHRVRPDQLCQPGVRFW